jgi:hypothetical protein
VLSKLFGWFSSQRRLIDALALERLAHADTIANARFTQVALEEQGRALAANLERSRLNNNLNMAALLMPLGGEVTLSKETVESVWGQPDNIKVNINYSEDGSVTVALEFIDKQEPTFEDESANQPA